MKYQGSKNRIAKHLLPIILKDRKEGQYYVEPFVGGANMIDKVDGRRIGYDVNAPLMRCFQKLTQGWIPPCEISRDFYSECRDKYNKSTFSEEEAHVIGYVGINGSYGGRWFDGGYAGTVTTKTGVTRNYPEEAYRNTMSQVDALKGVTFISKDYKNIKDEDLPETCIIYCDPPYEGTKEYVTATKSGYDPADFWEWCRDRVSSGHKVYISEYQAPRDFVEVWCKEVKSSLSANGKIGGSKKSVEKLFVHKSQITQNIS